MANVKISEMTVADTPLGGNESFPILQNGENKLTTLADIVAGITGGIMPGDQIKVAYEAEPNTNAFSNADVVKLGNIETNADVTDATNVALALTAGTNITISTGGIVAATDTTYISSDFTHDDLTGFVANEHIDWTTDQGGTNIHAGNYTDTNTVYDDTALSNAVDLNTAKETNIVHPLVETAVPAGALFTDTTYISSDFTHDDLTGFVANEHIDWTTDQGGTNIHAGNYTDTNTIYAHPNHSGEVTSTADGATVIADNMVDEANLKISNTPTDGHVLTAQSGNAGGLTWAAGSGGSSTTFSRKTGNYTASTNEAIIADTSGGSWTLILPASPSLGDIVRVLDGDDWATNNLTIGRNGSSISGDSEDLVMDLEGASVDFVYDDSTWQIYAQAGDSTGGTIFSGKTIHGDVNTLTVDGTNPVGFLGVPLSAEKTASYTLVTGDKGKCITIGSSGAITIPNSTFAAGDIVSVFNNTSSAATITCSTTTAYIVGENTDVASVTIVTRGIATVLFISSTVCVISGSIS